MAQDRKVFVGGVPQDLNQDDLYAIFSEYAGVKKAWLQKCRTADDGAGGVNPSPAQNHRGFGFVIFHDAHVIDELIGSGASRFIVLRNGAKLEVKRALSSNKMGAAQAADAAAAGFAAATHQQGQDLPQQQATGRAGGRGQAVRGSEMPLHLGGLQRSQQPNVAQSGRARAAGGQPQTVQWPGGIADAGVLRQQSLIPPGAACYPGAQQVLAGLGGGHLPRNLGHLGLGAGAEAACLDGFGRRLPPAGLLGAGTAPGVLGAGTAPGVGQSPYGACTPPEGGQVGRQVPLRDAIVRFYNEHRPEKLSEQKFIDFICSEYEGREELLDEALRHKYGIGLQLSAAGYQALNGAGGGGATRPGGGISPPSGPPGLLGTGPRVAAAAAGTGVAPEGNGTYMAAGLGVSYEPLYAPAAACTTPVEAPRPVRIPLAAPGLTLWHDRENSGDSGLGGSLAASNMASLLSAQGKRKGHTHQGAPAECSLLEDLDPALNDPEGPDFSWIDQIVGDDAFDISEELAKKIVNGKSPSMMKEALSGVVW